MYIALFYKTSIVNYYLLLSLFAVLDLFVYFLFVYIAMGGG
jgi:hypothetical protein